MSAADLLPAHLAATAPIRIREYTEMGGPRAEDIRRARETYAQELGAHGDALLYYERGTSERMAGLLTDAVAILAFAPGGVTLFGQHFEAQRAEVPA